MEEITSNQNTYLNLFFEDETEELNDQDLMMIVGGDGEAGAPEAEE